MSRVTLKSIVVLFDSKECISLCSTSFLVWKELVNKVEHMNIAVFFQKYGRNKWVSLAKRIYLIVFIRNDSAKIDYLRKAGATIGDNVHIPNVNQLGTEPYLVTIGDNVYFSGTETQLLTHDGGISQTYHMGISHKRFDCFGKIKIGDNCFIGIRCIIIKGVTIGDNCIIGAGSIVTKNIPSGSVACGVPARVIETVEEYYNKNLNHLDDTIGWDMYRKRKYLEDKYKQ